VLQCVALRQRKRERAREKARKGTREKECVYTYTNRNTQMNQRVVPFRHMPHHCDMTQSQCVAVRCSATEKERESEREGKSKNKSQCMCTYTHSNTQANQCVVFLVSSLATQLRHASFTVCCSAIQGVAVCCSASQRIAAQYGVLHCEAVLIYINKQKHTNESTCRTFVDNCHTQRWGAGVETHFQEI